MRMLSPERETRSLLLRHASPSPIATQSSSACDDNAVAWYCLLGCWLIEALAWGFPLSFGVFHQHYSDHPIFHADAHLLPLIGASATGVSYLCVPLTSAIALRNLAHRRLMCAIGYALCILSLLGASIAQDVYTLIAMQGALYGLGWVICYTPFLLILNEWFVLRRGLAYGILFSASGVSGLAIPRSLGSLLVQLDFRQTLRIYAVLMAFVAVPALMLIQPRQQSQQESDPDSPRQNSEQERPTIAKWAILRSRHCIFFGFAIFTQGLGYFVPNIFLPAYVRDLGLSTEASALLLGLMSISQIIGQLWQGWISDNANIYLPIVISTFLPGVASIALWGYGKSFVSLAIFCGLWGLFSSSFSVLYTRMCTFVLRDRAHEGKAFDEYFMMLYGIFSFERGLANILEGPICSFLLLDAAHLVPGEFAIGRYTLVVVFTTICMLASSLAGVG